MCGISGLIHFNERPVDKDVLVRMRDMLVHRGPDSEGYYIDDNLGLGFRRLAILDLSSAGNQPMVSENGRYAIVFNGEIYNYQSFRDELKTKGVRLKSTSDTEVLLNLYMLYGEAMLSRLNGMFAIAIWDKEKRELFLARDRMGVKPLYYACHNHTLYFASEPKALFAAGVPLIHHEDKIAEYLLCRFTGGEETLFSGVKRLLPGHYMVVKENEGMHITRWWNLADAIRNYEQPANPVAWMQETFDTSVRKRMISDVSVGILLSGGLDSGSICASLAQQQFSGVNTFTMGFSRQEHDETAMARQLANKYNFPFHTRRLEEEELHQHLVDATWYCDEPLVHLNEPHLLAISRMAKDKVTVLLSGEGADETLGGYVRYKPLKYAGWLQIAGLLVRAGVFKTDRWKKLERYAALSTPREKVMYNASNIFPSEMRSVYGIEETGSFAFRENIMTEAEQLYPGDLQRQALYYDQHLYLCSLLDRNDRTTMGASIECREPFLDPALLMGLGTLPSDMLFKGKKGKYLLCQAMKDRLPAETLRFKKIGFSVPWAHYLRHNDYLRAELDDMQRSTLFTMKFLEHINPGQLIYQFRRGDDSMMTYLLPLLTLHLWYKYYPARLHQQQAVLPGMAHRRA